MPVESHPFTSRPALGSDVRNDAAQDIVHVVGGEDAGRAVLCATLRRSGMVTINHPPAPDWTSSTNGDASGCLVQIIDCRVTDCLDLLTRQKAAGNLLPVVIVARHADVATALEAMRRGAVDFLQEPVTPSCLCAAVAEALACSRRFAATLQARQRIASLTRRERQVMERVVQGETNGQIGTYLGISERTVEVHRSNMMAKLAVTSVAELVQRVVSAS